MKLKILIVDDRSEQRDFYRQVVEKFFGDDCVVLWPDPTSSEILINGAQKLVVDNPGLAIAIVDTYLEIPEESKPRGLALLAFVRDHCPDCYRILVSTYIRATDDLLDRPMDEFVPTRFLNGRSPVDGLQEALRRGRKRHEANLQKAALFAE